MNEQFKNINIFTIRLNKFIVIYYFTKICFYVFIVVSIETKINEMFILCMIKVVCNVHSYTI